MQDLIRITVNTIGIQRLLDDGYVTPEEIQPILNYVTKHALFSYQAKTPVNTHELANQDIKIDFARSLSGVGRIYYDDVQIHENSYFNYQPGPKVTYVGNLINWLNTVGGSRRNDSEQNTLAGGNLFGTEDRETSTVGWIERAEAEFDAWLAAVDLSNV